MNPDVQCVPLYIHHFTGTVDKILFAGDHRPLPGFKYINV
jgi:hypothetical protein